jgi:hypothetical protein
MKKLLRLCENRVAVLAVWGISKGDSVAGLIVTLGLLSPTLDPVVNTRFKSCLMKKILRSWGRGLDYIRIKLPFFIFTQNKINWSFRSDY